jgi:hypothetical protein
MPIRLRQLRPLSAENPNHRRDQKQNDRNEENDLCRFHRNAGYAAKAQERRNERNDKKCESPANHHPNPLFMALRTRSLNNVSSF